MRRFYPEAIKDQVFNLLSEIASDTKTNAYVVGGFVRDYFEFTFVNFPIFNISDIFINVSVIVIMYMLLTKNKR